MEYSEPDLIIPALEILSIINEPLDTTELKTLIRQELNPTGDDLTPLKGRGDDKFAQKVRNLTGSHRTLENKSLVKRIDEKKFVITPEGMSYLLEYKEIPRSFTRQGFSGAERKKVLNRNLGNVIVDEGEINSVSQKVYQRSKKLIEYARDNFSDAQGRILCLGCGFDGATVYGDAGKGLIEIHHLRPLFLREGKTEAKQMKAALKEVIPLCPNCHRMVHREHGKLMSPDELRTLVRASG